MEFIGIVNVLVYTALLYVVPITLFVLWLAPKLSTRFSDDRKYSRALVGVGIHTVAVTWYGMFWFILLSTERTLVPCDMFVIQAPPPSTWERQLNDFFTRPPGSILPATVIVGVSGWLFVARLRRATNYTEQFRLFLIFAVTNLALMLVGLVWIIPLRNLPDLWLPQPRPPIDVGYHRTWLDLLGMAILILLLLFTQAKGMKLQRVERGTP